MDPSRGLSEDVLRACMAAALRGVDLPHFVVAHDIEGLAPGVYRWPDLSAPVRRGVMRDELYRVCLDATVSCQATDQLCNEAKDCTTVQPSSSSH